MTDPTAAPTAEITLGGEVRTLKYGFRAYKELDVNPFEEASMQAFIARPWNIDTAAGLIRAGLLHEYAKHGPRHGQEPPTVDEIIDCLDMQSLMKSMRPALLAMSGAQNGDVPEPVEKEEAANPLVAAV